MREKVGVSGFVGFCTCCRVKRNVFPLISYERKLESYSPAYVRRLAKGGARPGRPKGSGKYGEPTVPVRAPESLVQEVQELVRIRGRKIPVYRAGTVVSGVDNSPDDD